MIDRLYRLRTAFAHLQANRFAACAEAVRPLHDADPGDVEATLLLGLALGAEGDVDASAPMLAQVAAARPGNLHPCIDLARLLRDAGRVQDVAAHFAAARRLMPDHTGLVHGQATFLHECGQSDEAAMLLNDLLRQQPDVLPARRLLGIIHAESGRVQDAIELFRDLAARQPENAGHHANLGAVLATEARFEEAFVAFDAALARAPHDPRIRINHAVALLKSGRLRQGFAAFEWRLRLPGRTPYLPDAQLLTPGADVSGKRILLAHEEGLGDTLQFLRFAAPLAERGAHVIAAVPPPLLRIMRDAPGVAEVVEQRAILPGFDAHCPFLSLPRILGTTLQTIPARIPYLRADPALSRRWAARLPPGDTRVGLVWAGAARADDPGVAGVDRRRSMPLSTLALLGAARTIRFVSLQKGPAAAQAADPPFPLFDPMTAVEDFADTAAIIDNLDLVISVDTSVAHLAGAMGKPVFLLDRYDNCWRWLSGRQDSPWYPTLRIFRQTRGNDWAPVIARVAEALTGFRKHPLA